MKTTKQNHGYEHLNKFEAQKLTSIRERYCMDNFINILNKKAKYKKFEFNETSTNIAICYDGELKIFDKKQNLIGYFIVEIKVREDRFQDYIFEKKKKDNLLKTKEEKDLLLKIKKVNLECGILYINFMWNGVMLWDILELIEKGIIKRGIRKEMNKKTIVSRTDKVLKSCYYLKTQEGKYFTDFMFSNKSFLEYYKQINTPQTTNNIEFKTKTFNLAELF